MKRINLNVLMLGLGAVTLLACGPDAGEPPAPQSAQPPAVEPAPGETATAGAGTSVMSPGKPSAPISIDYEVVNKPIVGAPVQINVNVSSTRGPVMVRYSIADASAIRFQEGQVEEEEIRDASRRNVPRQLRVVPQREGRLYVNVSAEVQTAEGAMIRSMAIPLKVGAAPEAPTVNGEVREGPDGETVISMPAEERPN
jgi:hypothetical protein